MAESIKGLKRSMRCAEVTEEMIGSQVTLMGWVAKCRNKGGIVFVDMRDRTGIMQVIFEGGELGELAGTLRSEFCIAVTGTVQKRAGAVNENLKTGTMEVYASDLRILSKSETPPFHVLDGIETREELRLRYRYLDLRRPELQKKIMFRSRLVSLVREFMDAEGFLDIETPDLIGSTPEGARDYLVPSRVHPGSFYALPQSPQLFKQLLMCSGFDRYYQIARCFRDEDLRADRQPEFTQIDMELSFVEQDDVMDVNTRLLGFLLKRLPDVYKKLGFAPELAEAAERAAEKIEADLDIMGKEKSQELGSLSRILRFESRKRTDYREFLQRFSILREEAGIDLDSFDYGFYYYGMEMYGNMPLIEENEFREIRKVDSLVIAIDTSASCQKVLVQQFINETADLLSGIGSFFKKTEIHLIECDDRVQNDRLITDISQLQEYAREFEVKGGFGTDFRPVFNYIEDLRAAGQLENLKGLMYFTDGFGEYPKKPTDYDTAFVFWKDEELDDTGVPDWAIKLFLTPEGMETVERRGGSN